MKRGIIILVLVLMVFTSLNAGTLAIYTSTAEVAVLAVSAKRFVLSLNRGDQLELNLKLAPGERKSYNFEVTNTDIDGYVCEVGMDILIAADLQDVVAAIPGLQITLLRYGTAGYAPVATVGADGQLSYTSIAAFSASVSQLDRYSLSFLWPDNDSSRSMLYSKRVSVPLAMYVEGIQHVE
jgi:hypothetical protein